MKLTPEGEEIIEENKGLIKDNLGVIISAIFLGLGWYFGNSYGETHLLTIAAFIFSIVIGGYRLFKTGLINLARFEFDMKTLMTIAIIGASLIGEWGEGATVVILFAISEALEKYSMDKARASIKSLMDLSPKKARVLKDGKEYLVPVEGVLVNDLIVVKPSETIALDGIIINGQSAINQAAITGESIPVTKTIGDKVFAGTINEESVVEIKVTKSSKESTLAKIIHLVEEAQAEKAPSQAFVDKFAKYYTPAIMLIAFLIMVIPPMFDGDWKLWLYQGLSVLVVGCPCALIISTPVSIVTAIGNAARNGVLIKGGVYLEELGAVKSIAFDKTGTLTKGTPKVVQFENYSKDSDEKVQSILGSLEAKSQHPIARAIVSYVKERSIEVSDEINDFKALTGRGISGEFENKIYYVGSPSFISSFVNINGEIMRKITISQEEGSTVILLSNESEVLCLTAIKDELRDESKSIIDQIHNHDVKTVMLTGDNKLVANSVGKDIKVSEVYAELMPEEKLSMIKKLKDKYKIVAMVGDGVNDAPALATATVGIAMGQGGTDAAIETADIVLMGDDLKKLPYTIDLSKKTLKIIKQNITFSLLIKLVAILLVIPGWLTLWIAVFADMGATIIVTLNSLRLLLIKPKN